MWAPTCAVRSCGDITAQILLDLEVLVLLVSAAGHDILCEDARHWVCAVRGGVLTVACTAVQETHEDDENGFRRRERFVGKWERRFQLPENVSTASCLPVLADDCLQS